MKKVVKEYGIIICASIIFSMYVTVFLVPNKIGTGGVTGIALCLHHIIPGFKIGIFTICVNVPLFVFGYKIIGKKFATRSIFVIIFSSLLTDYINDHFNISVLNDKLLAAIFAGLISGIGMALLFMENSSTGGFDILAKAINIKFKYNNISHILLLQDIIVYIVTAFVFGPHSVMYAIIMSFVRSKTIDTLQEGVFASRQCIIICEDPCNIIEKINMQLGRSATVVQAEGGYSHEGKKMLYIVIQKCQLAQLKNIVAKEEPNAFVTVAPVNEILGNYKRRVTL